MKQHKSFRKIFSMVKPQFLLKIFLLMLKNLHVNFIPISSEALAKFGEKSDEGRLGAEIFGAYLWANPNK